jgi:putative salt-induced outer membrane protein YdiY
LPQRRSTRRSSFVIAALIAWCAVIPKVASAQAPGQPVAQAPADPNAPEEPGNWTGSVGGGIALTAGNSDTLTLNLSFDARRDPSTRHVMRWTGLFLRGEQNDEVTANRLALTFREQYALSDRAFIYAQADYLRDTFKAIDYLVAATGGLGFKLVSTERVRFVVNGGAGGVIEDNPGVVRNVSTALTAAEEFHHQITPNASITHSATALWKADDLEDWLGTISIGIATKISERVQLSIDALDVFKNRPPIPSTNRHDLVLVTAVTAKF